MQINPRERADDFVEGARRGGRADRLGRGSREIAEEATREGELCRDVTRGHQAVMPDLDEASGQNMQNEAPKELGGEDRDGGGAAGAKRDTVVVDRNEAPI